MFQDNPHGLFPTEIMLLSTPAEPYRIPQSTARRLFGLGVSIRKWEQYQCLLYGITLRITPDTITWKCLTSTDKLPVNVSGKIIRSSSLKLLRCLTPWTGDGEGPLALSSGHCDHTRMLTPHTPAPSTQLCLKQDPHSAQPALAPAPEHASLSLASILATHKTPPTPSPILKSPTLPSSRGPSTVSGNPVGILLNPIMASQDCLLGSESFYKMVAP